MKVRAPLIASAINGARTFMIHPDKRILGRPEVRVPDFLCASDRERRSPYSLSKKAEQHSLHDFAEKKKKLAILFI